MERIDLTNAMRMLQDYCGNAKECKTCLIEDECTENWEESPTNWVIGADDVE